MSDLWRSSVTTLAVFLVLSMLTGVGWGDSNFGLIVITTIAVNGALEMHRFKATS